MAHCVELLVPSTQAATWKQLNWINPKIHIYCTIPSQTILIILLWNVLLNLTVPAVDLDDKKVLCFKRDNPKSQTWRDETGVLKCMTRNTYPDKHINNSQVLFIYLFSSLSSNPIMQILFRTKGFEHNLECQNPWLPNKLSNSRLKIAQLANSNMSNTALMASLPHVSLEWHQK